MENSNHSEAQSEPGGLENQPHLWHWPSRVRMQKQGRDCTPAASSTALLFSCTAVKARFWCLPSISHFTWLGLAGFLKSRANEGMVDPAILKEPVTCSFGKMPGSTEEGVGLESLLAALPCLQCIWTVNLMCG